MNLIVCCTPLQVLIAEKIIELYPNEDFYGLMLAPFMNNKYYYYNERLRKKCTFSDLIVENEYSLLGISYKLKKWTIKINALYKVNRVFVANLNNFFIQGILSSINYQEFSTFDDGTASLIGFSNQKNEVGLKVKILKCLLNINGNIGNIERNRKQHFSIYEDVYIGSKTQFLNLTNTSKCISNKMVEKEMSILLGQPLFVDESKNYHLINYVLEEYMIDFYFPHPREKFTKYICQNKVIYSELIIEDYIIDLLKEYKKIKIYQFFSSAGLNLSQIGNIEIICFHIANIDSIDSNLVQKAYQIFRDNNFEVIELC